MADWLVMAEPVYTRSMTLLSENRAVAAVCQRLSQEDYVCVDTEFARSQTYFAQLCLVQFAGSREAVAIDALQPGLDLAPVLELMANPSVLKVFHACRQDLEIFYHLADAVPAPIFDTQIGAMVCGYGDAVSYDNLVRALTGITIDKATRFTNWSNRPLTEAQVSYALSDVIHLRPVYESLVAQIAANGRASWLTEEFAVVQNPATYAVDPQNAWRKLKVRNGKRRFLALLRELAAYRESEAQHRDKPRNWVLRDEIMLELAARAPRSRHDLAKVRHMSPSLVAGNIGSTLLEVVARGLALPESEWPEISNGETGMPPPRPLVDLLRVLLKHKADEHEVAQKLIASASDIEAIARDSDAPVAALRGWRREVFGADALALKNGELALTCNAGRVRLLTQ